MTPATRGDCLWVISQDAELCRRAELELAGKGCRVRQVWQADLGTATFWKNCPRYPGSVLLDVGDQLDAATRILKSMKLARVPSPVIVVTADQSREFGTKIVSLGVSYILPRDYTPGELAEVFVSLVKPRKMSHTSTEEQAPPPTERGFRP